MRDLEEVPEMNKMSWQELTEALFQANCSGDLERGKKIAAEMRKRPEQRARQIRFSAVGR